MSTFSGDGRVMALTPTATAASSSASGAECGKPTYRGVPLERVIEKSKLVNNAVK